MFAEKRAMFAEKREQSWDSDTAEAPEHVKLADMASKTRVTVASLFLVSMPCLTAAFWPTGGLTHTISCTADFGDVFTIHSEKGTSLSVSSALVIDRDAPVPKSCDGLSLAMEVQPIDPSRAKIVLPVMNTSTYDVKATAALQIGSNTTYIRVGLVSSGSTRTKTVPLKLQPGDTNIQARLIIGR